ncbi:hypothetical protein C2869_18840 [Saccharobesus litoralis]|uniref:Tetratricopeptide repeat-containing protein n=1 Tax=Saccharobesus litoralis TaxID=2172099 RepID=A0A2S0VVV5_9ALTE|nr:hypothetical protein [Saccharobesus litoralis]AWB68338.1 hypothetical protein C2869_18840 [Saccharobesus litoralis]
MKQVILAIAALMLVACAANGGLGNAQKLFNKGDYQSAILKIDRILDKYEYPEETKAQIYLMKAQSYEKLGQMENARSVYRYIEQNFKSSSAYTAAIEKLM